MAKSPSPDDSVSEDQNDAQTWQSMQVVVADQPAAVVAIDRQLRIVSADRLPPGYEPEFIVGLCAEHFLTPSDLEEVRQLLDVVFTRGEIVQFEVRDSIQKDWYSVCLVPQRTGDEVMTVLAVCRNISQCKKQEKEDEEAVRKSEELARAQTEELQQIYETAPVGLAVLDRECRCVRINEYLARANRRPVHEQIGRSVWEIVPPIAADVEAACRSVFTTGKPVLNREFQSPTAGETRFGVVSYFPLHGAAGEVSAVNVVVYDITQRKRREYELQERKLELEDDVSQATEELRKINQRLLDDIAKREQVEQDLREREEQIRAIFDAVPMPVVVSRPSDATVLMANDRLGELAGEPVENMIGKSYMSIYDSPEVREDLVRELQETGFLRDREIRLRFSKNIERWAAIPGTGVADRL